VSGFLLDTNVVSELRKGQRADAGFRTWLDAHVEDDFWLSVLVVGELRRGVELLARRDAASAAILARWLDETIEELSDRILPVTLAISQTWALLSVPDPVPVVDGLLAATALEHDLTLLTRNVTHVARTGVAHVNPFAR
jgi:predicted nucleic acid-binding protein